VAGAAGLRNASQFARPASPAGRPPQIDVVRARSFATTVARSGVLPHSRSFALNCSSRICVRW